MTGKSIAPQEPSEDWVSFVRSCVPIHLKRGLGEIEGCHLIEGHHDQGKGDDQEQV